MGTHQGNESRRIYAACLASYNAGTLHGRWIDAGQDAEAIAEEVRDMLAESPTPGAEEWAIHDYEGFDGIRLGEWEPFETVAAVAELLGEHDGAFAAWYGNESRDGDADGLRSAFEEDYAGEYDSEADWAEEFERETGGIGSIPERFRPYIDWEAIARDAHYNGDVWFADLPGGKVAAFRSR